MRYFTLKPQFALRGWNNLKYGILDLECMTVEKKVTRLTGQQFEALRLITSGGVSPDEKIFPDKIREMTKYAADKGFLEECSSSKTLEDYQKYNYSSARYTHTLLWSITGNCNLKCRHCYISSGDDRYGEISLEKCYEVIEQCKKANVNMVALTGGEPLVRKDFWKIVDRLLENHIKILQIFTNGVSLTEEFMNEFNKRKINPNCFMISFDGAGCHDWLRGANGAEQKAIDAIRLVKNMGYNVFVTTALHMGNIDALLETYELMKKLNVDVWSAAPIIDTGNWKNQQDNDINYSYIFNKYLELIKKYKEDEYPLELRLGGFFQNKGYGTNYKTPFLNGCGSCERCKDTLCEAFRIFPYLLPNGQLLPCISMSGSQMEQIAPNIFDKGECLETALSTSLVEKYTNYTYDDLYLNNSECDSCEHKYVCSGCRANALANGGFFAKDPLACCFVKGGYADKIKKIVEN